ncbi:MAG: hypothetical protein HYY16_15700, partial [Planctomycetes bacterium]|nr:hypothetical protein [Planctomycetota bacterium]
MSLFVSAFLVAMSCQEKGMQEVRALLENNIFSPPKAKKPETKVEKK